MENGKKFVMPPNIALGAIELNVSDAAALKQFYRDALGLHVLGDRGGIVQLGYEGRVILRLAERKTLGLAPRGSAGLFHFAIVFGSQGALARGLQNLMFKAPNSYNGSADHLVSEAFYAADPEGNGFELYTDRDQALWKYDGKTVLMATMYIDPKDYIFAHADKQGNQTMRLGHIHLKVGDLAAAKEFYVQVLGFDIANERVPGALFVSAGGYHHHIGVNIWESKGAGPREETLGMAYVEIYLPSPSFLEELKLHLSTNMVGFNDIERGISILDPWENEIHILAAGL